MSRVDSTTWPAVVQSYFTKTLLRSAMPRLFYSRFAVREPFKPNMGKTALFRRLTPYELNTVPILEGVPPTPQTPGYVDVSAVLRQWGMYSRITDIGEITLDHPAISKIVALQARNMGESTDVILRDTYEAGTSVVYAGSDLLATIDTRAEVGKDVSGVTNGTSGLISVASLNIVLRTLANNNADTFTEMVKAGTGVGTNPIRPAYWAVIHPDVAIPTLEELDGYVSVEQYGSNGKTLPGEIGAWKNIRFLMTTHAPVHANAGGTPTSMAVKSTGGTVCDVYSTLFFAEDAVGLMPLDKLTTKQILHKAGTSGALDPLDMITTVGWKRTGTQLILNDDFLVRLETTAIA